MAKKKTMTQQLQLFGDEELVPIPECSSLALELYGTPERVAQLTIEAARTKKIDDIVRAVMLDPHTAAELSVDDIDKMVREMVEAHGPYMAMYH
jgi:alpha-galactosidase/6-phospho-beta-glucosidase family protein